MDEKRVKEVFSDGAFVKSLMEKETPEEVQAALKEKGLELSLEEVGKIRDGVVSGTGKGGELTADQLDNVAGGTLSSGILGAVLQQQQQGILNNTRW